MRGPLKTAHLRRCPRQPLPAAYMEYASVGVLRAPRIWTILRGPREFEFLEVLMKKYAMKNERSR